MGSKESTLLRVRATGPLACFTRPEMKVERVSYEVMTPSAARGIFEAILWKPAIRWQVREIVVQRPIAWTSFRRNEVTGRASLRVGDYFVEERRVQRNSVALRDVDYVLAASFELTGRAGDDDNVAKFEEMFNRRLFKGQHFHQPYLGCRELAAEISPAPERLTPVDPAIDRPLGLMFYDWVWPSTGGKARPLFFDARLKGGVLSVPPLEAVLRANRPERE